MIMRLLRVLAVIVLCLDGAHCGRKASPWLALGPAAAPRPGGSPAVAAGGAAAAAAAGAAAQAHFGAGARNTTQKLPDAWGWDVIEMYCAAEAGGQQLSGRGIVRRFAVQDRTISQHYVLNCIDRYLKNGDPNKLSKRGAARRADTSQRKWIKAFLRGTPDAYFFEVRRAFTKEWGWSISEKMISAALSTRGARGDADDLPLSLKVLERVARQRNEETRRRCREGFAGFPARCLLFFDESSVDRRTLRRRRGWAPVGAARRLRMSATWIPTGRGCSGGASCSTRRWRASLTMIWQRAARRTALPLRGHSV